jgi:hypothetical protein
MHISPIEIIAGAILLIALGGVVVRAIRQQYQKYKNRNSNS